MAWTDAARAASLAVRRAHMRPRVTRSGKKATPMRWYHGGGAIKGHAIKSPQGNFNWAITNIQYARSYARKSDGGKGAVYRVRVPKMPTPQRMRFWNDTVFGRRKALITQVRPDKAAVVLARIKLPVIARLPHARGRAARGKY